VGWHLRGVEQNERGKRRCVRRRGGEKELSTCTGKGGLLKASDRTKSGSEGAGENELIIQPHGNWSIGQEIKEREPSGAKKNDRTGSSKGRQRGGVDGETRS